MNRKTWLVNPEEDVIKAADLAANPDGYGGPSMHMACAIQDAVITIPLRREASCEHVSVQVTDGAAANRILTDGKVWILSTGFWGDIRSPKVKVVYFGTDELIPLWRGGIR